MIEKMFGFAGVVVGVSLMFFFNVLHLPTNGLFLVTIPILNFLFFCSSIYLIWIPLFVLNLFWEKMERINDYFWVSFLFTISFYFLFFEIREMVWRYFGVDHMFLYDLPDHAPGNVELYSVAEIENIGHGIFGFGVLLFGLLVFVFANAREWWWWVRRRIGRGAKKQ